jgi:hypothetical protein
MPDITFIVTQRNGDKAHGIVEWPAKQLKAKAVSGSPGAPAINLGTWQARPNELLDKPAGSAYCDTAAGATPKRGHCWFQPFVGQFGRTEIGLHPDGGTPDATNGCIGLQIADAKSWYDALIALQQQDITLSVEVREGTPTVASG